MKETKEARKELWNNNRKQRTKNKAKRAGIKKNLKGVNERRKKERNERRNNQKKIKEEKE